MVRGVRVYREREEERLEENNGLVRTPSGPLWSGWCPSHERHGPRLFVLGASQSLIKTFFATWFDSVVSEDLSSPPRQELLQRSRACARERRERGGRAWLSRLPRFSCGGAPLCGATWLREQGAFSPLRSSRAGRRARLSPRAGSSSGPPVSRGARQHPRKQAPVRARATTQENKPQ